MAAVGLRRGKAALQTVSCCGQGDISRPAATTETQHAAIPVVGQAINEADVRTGNAGCLRSQLAVGGRACSGIRLNVFCLLHLGLGNRPCARQLLASRCTALLP